MLIGAASNLGLRARRTMSKLILPISLFVVLNSVVIHSQYGDIRSITQPVSLSGDALFGVRVFANLEQYGSWSGSHHLGWPEGQNLWDYPPVADLGNMGISYLLVAVIGNAITAINVLYLLGFNLQLVAGYVGVRILGKNRWIAWCSGFVFALAPYHFDRGIAHLYLSNYAILILVLCFVMAELKSSRERAFETAARYCQEERLRCWFVLGLASSAFGVYYALFSAIIFSTAIILLILTRAETRRIAIGLSGLTTGVVTQVGVVRLMQSGGVTTPIRQVWESDLYSLKPILLLTPSPWSQFEKLASVKGMIDSAIQFPGEPTASLGILLSVSLLFGTLKAIWIVGFRRANTNPTFAVSSADTTALVVFPVALAVVMISFAVSGGAASYISLIGLEEFRVWSRSSIVLTSIAVVLLAGFLDDLRLNVYKMRSVAVATLVMIMAIGLAELVFVQRNEALRSQTQLDAYMAQSAVYDLEKELAAGAILQLPMVPFPESPPVNDMTDYAHFLPTLYTTNYSWSYGNVRYSGNDVPCDTIDLNIAECVLEFQYQAIWIDGAGFDDGGAAIRSGLVTEFERMEIQTLTRSPNERYSYILLQR